ncbi:hypothetical protein TNCV_2983191 [Trichonephila clavipes]|nr:hypothetical protein TNCV_2983191 [Trichonephila clavipes]
MHGQWLPSDWLVTICQSLRLMKYGILLKLRGYLSNLFLTECPGIRFFRSCLRIPLHLFFFACSLNRTEHHFIKEGVYVTILTGSVSWPPRSPDLSLLEFSLGCHEEICV